MKHSISIADVARAANVSHSTVSRALRDSPLISAEVRQRVQHLAREMGYTPNAIAQSLKQQRTNTLGLIVTSIADPFYADVIKGVEETARPAGMSVFISATYNDESQELAVIETFHRRKVDGIIVVSSRIAQNYQRLRRLGVPAVLVNNEANIGGQVLHSVLIDDYAGASLAMRHLIDLGHRQIGYLGITNRPYSNEQRHRAYLDALRAAGLPIDPRAIMIVDSPGPDTDDVLASARQMPRMLESGVTAVFCYNDLIAIGALLACRERGIVVPGQLSVVGFDDIALAQYVSPSLTTVAQPRRDLGGRAMRMLLDLMDGQPVTDVVLAPTLSARSSTASPP
ncbi:MAG: LacI family transcriptional regulator [Oscillochloris sp.]|nr:LacI family transcriptional regulator [Oscillochloris sp.]